MDAERKVVLATYLLTTERKGYCPCSPTSEVMAELLPLPCDIWY